MRNILAISDNGLTVASIQVPGEIQRHQCESQSTQTVVPTPCLFDTEFRVDSHCYTYDHQGYADCTCNNKSWSACNGIDKVAFYTWWGGKSWKRYKGEGVV